MPEMDGQNAPLWAAGRARKQTDILREAARVISEADRKLAGQPLGKFTERDLETEQLRLEELLFAGTMTVEEFCRLREVDHLLDGMRQRKQFGSSREGSGRPLAGD